MSFADAVPRICLSITLAFLAGCASVPTVSPEDDNRAKTFSVAPGQGNIYVYRNETFGAAVSMLVSLDERVAGNTASMTYFLFEVPPGMHEVASHGENKSSQKLMVEAGKRYFVWQEMKMGLFQPRSELRLMDEATGRAAVMECKRIISSL